MRKAKSQFRQLAHLPPRLIQLDALGHHFVVRESSLPDIADYDDGWQLALAFHSHVALDVGANVGQSTLHLLLSPTVTQVVLVEANPDALVTAAENLIRSGMVERARFVGAFAGETDGEEISFWTVGTGAAGSRFAAHAVTAAGAGRNFKVSTLTLDTICRRFDILPDLIKIDTEGAEHQVLLGSRECARQKRTRFMVEMHANPELTMTDNATKVLAWCHSQGYVAWYLAKEMLLETPQPIAHRGRCHLLLQPADWPYPDWLRGIAQSAPPEEVWKRFAKK
ncbi:MAG: FkbM family methyltransferase [Verrucomicrobia bacterium]|nr:FkbM family methyltransferase [Verrucomicrobiota bacterium]